MFATITPEGQITLPAALLRQLRVGPGDRLEFIKGPDGIMLIPKTIDLSKLAPLSGSLSPNIRPFDLTTFRNQLHGHQLRD